MVITQKVLPPAISDSPHRPVILPNRRFSWLLFCEPNKKKEGATAPRNSVLN